MTPYEKLKRVRARAKADLVAVRVGNESFDLPKDKVDDLRKWCADQVKNRPPR